MAIVSVTAPALPVCASGWNDSRGMGAAVGRTVCTMRTRGLTTLLLAAVLVGGCGHSSSSGSSTTPTTTTTTASAPAPPPSRGAGAALRDGDARFGGRLLVLAARGNPTVAMSPFSVSQALSMALAGARGPTAAQMMATLDLRLPRTELFAAWRALNVGLSAATRSSAVRLDLANALYGQSGLRVRRPFLDVLQQDFRSPLRTVDFVTQPAAALAQINRWVASHTSNQIPQLLTPADVDMSTRLVLVNAVYLKARWMDPFRRTDTFAAPFHAPLGTRAVPTMHLSGRFGYASGAGYRVLELPYAGGRLAFDILLPAPGRLSALLTTLQRTGVLAPLAHLRPQRVRLALPKLRIRTRFELAPALRELGMPLAFTPGHADFTGIAGRVGELYIHAVAHEAYLSVDEAGTEAAAATGVSIGPTAILVPPASIPFTVDHPFAFLLRDRDTGAILFAGVVSQP